MTSHQGQRSEHILVVDVLSICEHILILSPPGFIATVVAVKVRVCSSRGHLIHHLTIDTLLPLPRLSSRTRPSRTVLFSRVIVVILGDHILCVARLSLLFSLSSDLLGSISSSVIIYISLVLCLHHHYHCSMLIEHEFVYLLWWLMCSSSTWRHRAQRQRSRRDVQTFRQSRIT